MRHFLAPVTIDLKNARRRLRAQEEEEEEEEEESLSREFFLFGRRERERERERGIYTHTHDDESFSRFKSVPFFFALSQGTRIFTLISLLKVVVVVALPSARIVFSPSQTQIHRERVSESAFTRVVVVVA